MSVSPMYLAKADVVFHDGSHQYWSTHCRHDHHDACAVTELAPGIPREPAQCKSCGAPCLCGCHGHLDDEGGTA